jgi:V/A-type H+-transporting ATPase subunit I
MGQKFLRLLIYGGFAAAVGGVLTGGWFAIPSESLPQVLKNLRLFDPLSPGGPIIFLLVSLGFGFLQLFFGVFLEMVDHFRRGKVLDGLIDQGSVLMLLPGAALMVIWMFWSVNSGGTPLWAKVGLVLIITGSLLTVFFRNRQSKSWAGRVGGGLYSLYQMSSFLGDTVSYARLMALGIATTLIGWAFNILGGMIMAVPVVGIIIGGLLLVVLHAISLAINLIGAVVHPLRLQYVEFFTKFFEGGGEGFKPFSIFTKNVILRSKGG